MSSDFFSREDVMQPFSGKYSWRDKPAVPVSEAAELLGCSRSHVYGKIKSGGPLQAVRVVEKVLITTASIAALLDNPESWTPRRERVDAANKARLNRLEPSRSAEHGLSGDTDPARIERAKRASPHAWRTNRIS
jgi:excisionase family DNA binding protein